MRFLDGPVSDGHLNRALYHLRSSIIRDDQEGLDHVEALLSLRGCDPDAHHVRQKRPVRFHRRELRGTLIKHLNAGAKTLSELVSAIHNEREGEDLDKLQKRIATGLTTLKKEGVVGHKRPQWWLVTPDQPSQPALRKSSVSFGKQQEGQAAAGPC